MHYIETLGSHSHLKPLISALSDEHEQRIIYIFVLIISYVARFSCRDTSKRCSEELCSKYSRRVMKTACKKTCGYCSKYKKIII